MSETERTLGEGPTREEIARKMFLAFYSGRWDTTPTCEVDRAVKYTAFHQIAADILALFTTHLTALTERVRELAESRDSWEAIARSRTTALRTQLRRATHDLGLWKTTSDCHAIVIEQDLEPLRELLGSSVDLLVAVKEIQRQLEEACGALREINVVANSGPAHWRISEIATRALEGAPVGGYATLAEAIVASCGHWSGDAACRACISRALSPPEARDGG